MPRKKKEDPLDTLANGDPKDVIALILWKNRNKEPDMSVQITEHDIKGFQDCVEYLKVTPEVTIKRPQGMPAQVARRDLGSNRTIPAREAIPPRDYIVVNLVEKGTENRIVPVENNQEDYDKQQQAAAVRKARDQAQSLADALIGQARTGEFSTAVMQDAAQALVTMAVGLR